MKIVYLVGLLLCATLHLTIGLDITEIVTAAQCQSLCLRNLTSDDQCLTRRKGNTECPKCWDTCEFLAPFQNNIRLELCKLKIYMCPGCRIACTFYRTHGTEEKMYETATLPAPEKDNVVNINKHDVAVTLWKKTQDKWGMKQNHFTNRDVIKLEPGDWIIITNETGAIKQYSWEKWEPTVKSGKRNGFLFQINITWTDWQDQLKKQWENVSKNFKSADIIFADAKIQKPFVVTWQEKTENGVTGHQEADSESAQISVQPGEYLVRIATDDGPGSYPIVINTDKYATEEYNSSLRNKYISAFFTIFLTIVIFVVFIALIPIIRYFKKRWRRKEITEIEMIELPAGIISFEEFSDERIFISDINSNSISDASSTRPLIERENSEQISNNYTSSSTRELNLELHAEQTSNNNSRTCSCRTSSDASSNCICCQRCSSASLSNSDASHESVERDINANENIENINIQHANEQAAMENNNEAANVEEIINRFETFLLYLLFKNLFEN